MNNKQAIIWIIVAVFIMGGSLWYLAGMSSSNGGTNASSTSWTATSTATSTSQTGGTKTTTGGTKTGGTPIGAPAKTAGIAPLTYLLGLKEDLKCTVSTSGAPVKRSGTLYVGANGVSYGIFTGLVNGVSTTANMIDDGSYLYVWTAGSKTGYKGLAAISANGSAVAMRGGVDPAQKLSFSCNLWTADPSILALPTDVTFSGN